MFRPCAHGIVGDCKFCAEDVAWAERFRLETTSCTYPEGSGYRAAYLSACGPVGHGDTPEAATEALFLAKAPCRCRQPLWWGYGSPAGLCGKDAYGADVQSASLGPNGELARCSDHGGRTAKDAAILRVHLATLPAGAAEVYAEALALRHRIVAWERDGEDRNFVALHTQRCRELIVEAKRLTAESSKC